MFTSLLISLFMQLLSLCVEQNQKIACSTCTIVGGHMSANCKMEILIDTLWEVKKMKAQIKKICSILLIFALLINILPMEVLGTELQSAMSSHKAADFNAHLQNMSFISSNAEIVAEIKEARTKYSKEFLLSNGLNLSITYPQAVHFLQNDEWEDVDNTLRMIGSGVNAAYTNTAGDWKVTFPQQLNRNQKVSITKDQYTLAFGMAGEISTNLESVTISDIQHAVSDLTVSSVNNVQAQIRKMELDTMRDSMAYPETFVETLFSKLIYENVYQDTNLEYELDGSQVKESIILEEYNPSVSGYRYTLEVNNLSPVLGKDGSIVLKDSVSGEVVMTMPAPFLVDNAGEVSTDIGVQLTESGNNYILTYHMPMQWLASSERTWPVILDPIVSIDTYNYNVLDLFVTENDAADHLAHALECGYDRDSGKTRSLIKFNNLPELHSADVIVNATLSLTSYAEGSTPVIIEAHQVIEDWTGNGFNWANQPAYSTIVEDFANVQGAGNYCWNITDMVREWYTDANTGLMLKATDSVESAGSHQIKRFRSAEHGLTGNTGWPNLAVVYRNTNGLESYWDYTSHSAGRAGVGYINNYSGNLVWMRSDLGFGGNRMPVSISHIYNSNDAFVESNNSNGPAFGLGIGWRTNYHQRVEKIDEDQYVWEDADGTKHYFYKNTDSESYADEDGMELTLSVVSGLVTIADKDGNISRFDNKGRLIEQQNNQETHSSILISYTSTNGNTIANITDGVGRKYYFTYDNNLLSKITYVGKSADASQEISSVSYFYTGELLTRIVDKDGESSVYDYSGNYLVSATDVDGYRLTYQYTETEPKKISQVNEYQLRDGAMAAGGEVLFTYAHNQTVLTDHNNNTQIMQFNDWGNVVSVQDNEGCAQYAKYALTSHNESPATNEETSAKANQLRISSQLQNTVVNLANDGSFERGSSWSTVGSGVTASASTDYAYYGARSLKIVSTSTANNAGAYGEFSTNDNSDSNTIVFSAYVKTLSGANAKLALCNNSGTVVAASDLLASDQDWTRLEVSYTGINATSLIPYVLTTSPGTCYVDCVQIEDSPTASRYNLLDFGDDWNMGLFSMAWSKLPNMTGDSAENTGFAAAPHMSPSALRISGDPLAEKYVSQRFVYDGAAGDCYVLSGWAYGDATPTFVINNETEADENANVREFGLKLIFNYTDGTTKEIFVEFNPDIPSNGKWQMAATPAVAEKDYSSIIVQAVYSYGANAVYFDGLQLFKESFGPSYTYDSEGKLISVVDLQKEITNYEYDANDRITSIIQTKTELSYEYDTYNNVIKAMVKSTAENQETTDGLVYNFTYDTYGNNLSVSAEKGGLVMQATAEYTTDGNRLYKTTDALDNVTTYCYNENTNVLEWVQYPEDTENTRTTYSYDSMYRLAQTATQVEGINAGTGLSASYSYTDDRLTGIITPSTGYTLEYGDFSRVSSIKIGTRTLASYSYTEDQNRYLDTLTYGNGDHVTYAYDDQGRVISETYEDGGSVTYDYDNTGALATITDSATGRKTTYYYDLSNRKMMYVESGDEYSHSVGYEYDTLNNLTKLVETLNGVKTETNFVYDDYNRVTGLSNGSSSRNYIYDELSRLNQRTTKDGEDVVLTDSFTFLNSTNLTTSMQVASMLEEWNGCSVEYEYVYDGNGNILEIRRLLVNSLGKRVISWQTATSYVYDSQNQLIRENNQVANKTWVWEYDNAGNILCRKEYNYTTGTLGTATDTVTYTYADSVWGDLLTGYNGNPITYDANGNPLTNGTWTYTWEHGRKLESMSNGTSTWNYTYDSNGMRTMRTDGSTTYSYVYNGGQLMQMTRGSDTLNFTYDANGLPLTVTYNGTTYYYVTNLQGDVTCIISRTGANEVVYEYDAWGNILSIDGFLASTLGQINPLRYRGYVYDNESGYYYLQSRYYDPEIGRFLNADSYITTGQGCFGNNMFAYCLNNPTIFVDTSGDFPWLAIGFILGVACIGGILGATADEKLAENPEKDNSHQDNSSKENIRPTPHPAAPNTRIPDKLLLDDDAIDMLCPETIVPEPEAGNKSLTTADRIENTAIGTSLGLGVGGLGVAVTGAVMVVGGVTGGLQIFAIGALAYNIVAIIIAPFIGAEMEPIEIEP